MCTNRINDQQIVKNVNNGEKTYFKKKTVLHASDAFFQMFHSESEKERFRKFWSQRSDSSEMKEKIKILLIVNFYFYFG